MNSEYSESLVSDDNSESSMETHAEDDSSISGEASPTFGQANANFPVFIDRKRNQFLKK